MKNALITFSMACCLLSNSLIFSENLTDTVLKKTQAPQVNEECMQQILAKRYSGYAFNTDRSVSHAQIKTILEAGRLAPSSYNEQPWNFIVCDKAANPKAFQDALSALVEFNQNWAKHASVLIISVASSKSSHKNEPNDWGQYDTGAAAFSMMLQATSLELMAHQMGGFDQKKVSQLFSIPADYKPMSVMAIGYPSPDEAQSERKRKDLGENFFAGTWGQKFE